MISAARTIDQDEARQPSAISVFRERAEARAMLVANGMMDLQAAVDGMQELAASTELVLDYGQDEVQRILSEAFARSR
jgi:hypothetical protein